VKQFIGDYAELLLIAYLFTLLIVGAVIMAVVEMILYG
jgi:hypothetical protein